jgi:hypothetical protein
MDHHGVVDTAASSSLYRGHRYPMEIMSHCVWLYHRFPLSLREVQEMMAERGDCLPGKGPEMTGTSPCGLPYPRKPATGLRRLGRCAGRPA